MVEVLVDTLPQWLLCLRPDLYKSSVAYIGVFDLEMLYNEGDIRGIKWGGKYLR